MTVLVRAQWENVLCVQEERVVGNDNIVAFQVGGVFRPFVAAMRHHRLAKERKRADGARVVGGSA
jgi:hypothetical protein